MDCFYLVLIVIFGLIMGSFISAFSYRLPRNIDFIFKRSICPVCKHQLSWYDNLPIIGFLILKGKCRYCDKKISIRYPLIEISTSILFVFTFLRYKSCLNSNFQYGMCSLVKTLGVYSLPLFLLLLVFLITIFIIDLETQLIPDSLTFFLFVLFSILLILVSPTLFSGLLAGFVVSSAFLILHLITKGRGMGLGDVKFALTGGLIIGWPSIISWLYLSFITGAVIGVLLILLKKAKFGRPIPFAPFLITSLIVVLFWGDFFNNLLLSFIP